MGSRKIAAALAAIVLAGSLAACGSGAGSDPQPDKLTYWASNQGTSIANDEQVLKPELEKFEQRTGIEVELEVIPWSDLLNRILTATSSGQGPDVVNVGNTWSASLQATGAFVPFDQKTLKQVGGADRFLASSLAATGAEGSDPAFVPLYGLSYGLFYNKRMFAEAGIDGPPSTWAELVEDARRLTDPARGRYGVGIMGASYTENAHFAFIFGKQHGAQVFDGNTPRFDDPKLVAGVRQYVDLLARHRVVNPSNAEYANDTEVIRDFASGKVAMLMFQNYVENGIQTNGMKLEEYGVAPIPMPDPLPAGGQRVNSHVAGINIGVMANTDNRAGALKLVEFLTSPEEQKILNAAYRTLPVVPEAYEDPAFRTPNIEIFRSVLAKTAVPMPNIPAEAQFETLIGTAVRELLADAAAGRPVGDAEIRAKLAAAQRQMASSG